MTERYLPLLEAGPVPDPGELTKFLDRFNSCLHEIGQEGAYSVGFSLDTGLFILGPPNADWEAAALRALKLTASTFPPAAYLLSTLDSAVIGPSEAWRWL